MNFCQAIQRVKELAVSIEGKSLEEKKTLLAKCAATTLSSKLIGGEKEFFASMVVDAVLAIGNDDRLNLIGIKKVILQCSLARCSGLKSLKILALDIILTSELIY